MLDSATSSAPLCSMTSPQPTSEAVILLQERGIPGQASPECCHGQGLAWSMGFSKGQWGRAQQGHNNPHKAADASFQRRGHRMRDSGSGMLDELDASYICLQRHRKISELYRDTATVDEPSAATSQR